MAPNRGRHGQAIQRGKPGLSVVPSRPPLLAPDSETLLRRRIGVRNRRMPGVGLVGSIHREENQRVLAVPIVRDVEPERQRLGRGVGGVGASPTAVGPACNPCRAITDGGEYPHDSSSLIIRKAVGRPTPAGNGRRFRVGRPPRFRRRTIACHTRAKRPNPVGCVKGGADTPHRLSGRPEHPRGRLTRKQRIGIEPLAPLQKFRVALKKFIDGVVESPYPTAGHNRPGDSRLA